jgi:hypothetical protein
MKRFLFGLLFSATLYGQCTLSGSLTATGVATATLDNTTSRCSDWTLSVQTSGPVASYSLQLQGDFGSGFISMGSPCTTITTCNTSVKSLIPNTLRVNLTALSTTGSAAINYTITGGNPQPLPPTPSVSAISPYLTIGTKTFGPVCQVTVPPLTGWTFDNQGASTLDTTFGYPYGHFPISSATNTRMLYRTAPATPYSITALISASASPSTPPNTDQAYTFGFRDGAGKIEVFMIGTAVSNYSILVTRWTNSTTFTSNPYLLDTTGITVSIFGVIAGPPIWKIVDDGTNITYNISVDCANHFQQVYTELRTAFFAAGPTQVGFGAYTSTAGFDVALLSWLQGIM